MGRTNPTYRMRVRSLRRKWEPYRRALRRRDRPHFDRLFEQAERYADAGSHLNATDPVVPVLVSILLEQEKRLAALEKRPAALERDASTEVDGDEDGSVHGEGGSVRDENGESP